MSAVHYDAASSPVRDDVAVYEMNARRRPVPRPAEDVALVESLRFAVPLWILEQRGATPADLMRAAARCAWAVGERGDNLMFRAAGEPTKSERNSAALAFEGLARGLAAVALLEGRVEFAGLHWCTAAHPDCPNPAPQRRTPVEEEVRRVVEQLDEFEHLLTVLSDPDRDDGPELPADQQCSPGDPGVWAIWEGGPIKAGHDAAFARFARAMAAREPDPQAEERRAHLDAYNRDRADVQDRYRSALNGTAYGSAQWREAWGALHADLAALDAKYWPDGGGGGR